MARGERVPRRRAARGLHDGELRVEHPRPRDAEDQLEPLVDDRAAETDGEYIVALPLADAPEHGDGEHHEHRLVAELGDRRHERVQRGRAQGFQKP